MTDWAKACSWRPTALWPAGALTVFMAWSLALGSVSAATLTASLEPQTMTLGEGARLSLTFNGGNPETVPQVPSIENLQIQYVGPSTSLTIINGEVSSTATHTYNVIPRQAGDYTIPSIKVRVGGTDLVSQPLTLRVQKPGAAAPDAISSGNQLAFMKLSLPRQQAYVGETIVAELQVYFHPRLSGRGRPQFTSFATDGFNTGQVLEGQARQVRVGEATYIMVPYSVPLKAIKTGPMALGPATATVVVELPGGPRRPSMLEQFGFRDPFDRGEQRQVSMATEELKVESLPLPAENVPPTFNNAIGRFTISVEAGPTNVAAGDPVTVRVHISGQGNLEALALPGQGGWENLKVYPPTSKIETDDPFSLRGTKIFEQVVVPESPQVKHLPAFTFSFFDPQAKAYRELKSAPIALVVRPGGAPATPLVAANRDGGNSDPAPAQDIVHIKQQLGASFGTAAAVSGAAPVPLLRQPWFIGLQAVPLLAWLSAIAWRKRVDNLANNPRLRRRRQVEKLVQEGLADLRRHAAARDSDQFFATLFRLLQERIGERLDAPSSSITDGVVEEQLRGRNLDPLLLAQIQELFQACNQARYAPVRSTEELEAFLPRTEATLRQLGSQDF